MKLTLFRCGVGAALAVLFFASTPDANAYTMWDKLQRGFINMTTGIVEIPGNMVDLTEREGAGKGMTLGFLKGLGMVPVRSLVGVYEFVGFMAPLPGDYDPVLDPETPLGYWK